jgi:arylsulfatase A-like enzyme
MMNSIALARRLFLYIAPGATHAPHHARADWIAKSKGTFDMGSDKYRDERLERQNKLGLVRPDTKLTARPPGLPWESRRNRHVSTRK